jgi:hypothetical protein
MSECWRMTDRQVQLLRPARTLVLGKGLWKWYRRQPQFDSGDAYIPRMRGDQAMARAAVEIVGSLSRNRLLPQMM